MNLNKLTTVIAGFPKDLEFEVKEGVPPGTQDDKHLFEICWIVERYSASNEAESGRSM